MKVQVSAPSNIALIKYMGKTDAGKNRPLNASLSWTLEGLRSDVEVEWHENLVSDRWEPFESGSALRLSEKGIAKFLNHVDRVRKELGRKEHFIIRSRNSFPSDAGIASSASSFAALTMGVVEAFSRLDPERPKVSLERQSELSRQGSGSSCRSFFSPWSLWSSEGAQPIDIEPRDLIHQVILVDSSIKLVSSSEAHVRCTTSALFANRKERAENRLNELVSGFRTQDWEKCFHLVWAEFWDMHALFETSNPPFGYLKSGTLNVLEQVQALWRTEKDGPLATLDAGPNVHLLWRSNQLLAAQDFSESLKGKYTVLTTLPKEKKAESN
jgi:diphosphomevalonate decarboxylase